MLANARFYRKADYEQLRLELGPNQFLDRFFSSKYNKILPSQHNLHTARSNTDGTPLFLYKICRCLMRCDINSQINWDIILEISKKHHRYIRSIADIIETLESCRMLTQDNFITACILNEPWKNYNALKSLECTDFYLKTDDAQQYYDEICNSADPARFAQDLVTQFEMFDERPKFS